MLVKGILERFPEHSILAEEGVEYDSGSEYLWIVDPLDGTTNFVHGLPLYCVSIALYRMGKPFIGVCYNPARDDLFCAERGQGAFLNGEKLEVSDSDSVLSALLVTGFPYESDQMDIIMDRFARVVGKAQGVRRLGSAALDLCYVASGALDGFWETGLKPWDMAAGVVIVQEAGGRITALNGSDFNLFDGQVLATNQRIHDELSQLM